MVFYFVVIIVMEVFYEKVTFNNCAIIYNRFDGRLFSAEHALVVCLVAGKRQCESVELAVVAYIDTAAAAECGIIEEL